MIWTAVVHQDKICVRDGALDRHHLRTYVATASPPPIAFLRACRRIYTEAALLSFANNTFGLWSHRDKDALLQTLSPAQTNAIRKVQLLCRDLDILAGLPGLTLAEVICLCGTLDP